MELGLLHLGFSCCFQYTAAHPCWPTEPSALLPRCLVSSPLTGPFDQCAAFDPAQGGAPQQREQSGGKVDSELLQELHSALDQPKPACLQTCLASNSSIEGDNA